MGDKHLENPCFSNLTKLVHGQNIIAGLHSLFLELKSFFQDAGKQINRRDYGSGYTALCFDLSPGHFSGDHFELIKQGNFRVEIQV